MSAFLDLLDCTLGFSVGLFLPFTVLALGAGVCVAVASWERMRDGGWRSAWRCFIPGAIPLVMVLFAATWLPDGPECPEDERWIPASILHVLVVSHIPLTAALAWGAGRAWPFVLAASLAWGALTVSALGVGGMAASGVWL